MQKVKHRQSAFEGVGNGIFEAIAGLPIFRQFFRCLVQITYQVLEYSPSPALIFGICF
jgi:hypothetical protein